MTNSECEFQGGVLFLFFLCHHWHFLFQTNISLTTRNADLDARDESGWLPVHWAAQSGSVETLCNLHYLGADFVSRTSGTGTLTIGLGLDPM